MKGFLNRLLGRTDGGEDEAEPIPDIDEERSETVAVDRLGGFDPNDLIQDDRPRNDF
jgi:hypothetical protein